MHMVVELHAFEVGDYFVLLESDSQCESNSRAGKIQWSMVINAEMKEGETLEDFDYMLGMNDISGF